MPKQTVRLYDAFVEKNKISVLTNRVLQNAVNMPQSDPFLFCAIFSRKRKSINFDIFQKACRNSGVTERQTKYRKNAALHFRRLSDWQVKTTSRKPATNFIAERISLLPGNRDSTCPSASIVIPI